jgi:outer membrane receptor protein involved in Fe transport
LFSDKDGTAQAVANIGPSLADITSFNQELRLASQGSGPFRWLIGANYEDSETFEDQTLTFANGSSSAPGTLFINTTGSEVSQKIRNYAFFANGEYDFTDALTFKLGGRYTNSRNRADLCSTANGDGAVATLFNILPGAVFGVPAGSFTPISTGDCYPLNSQNVRVSASSILSRRTISPTAPALTSSRIRRSILRQHLARLQVGQLPHSRRLRLPLLRCGNSRIGHFLRGRRQSNACGPLDPVQCSRILL